MRSWIAFALLASACDPIWHVGARVRDPASRPIEGATLALGCPDGPMNGATGMVSTTDVQGATQVVGMGFGLPPDCDVFVVKRGYRTHRIPYAALCPEGRERCDRAIGVEVVLKPE